MSKMVNWTCFLLLSFLQTSPWEIVFLAFAKFWWHTFKKRNLIYEVGNTRIRMYYNFHFGYIRRPIKAKTSCFDFIRSQNIPLSLSFQSQNVARSALNPSYFQNCIIKITFPHQNKNHSQLNHARNKIQTKLGLRPKSSCHSRESTHINPFFRGGVYSWKKAKN